MKLTSLLILIFCLVTSLNAQTLTAEFYPVNSASNLSQIPLQNGLLSVAGDMVQFGTESRVTMANPLELSVSADGRLVGALQNRGGLSAYIFNDEGAELVSAALQNINSGDETLGFTLLNSGEFIVRDNVANFSFFDASGNRRSTYSNSANTAGGEKTSQVAVSSDGVLTVVYNPVIQYQNEQGSRISIVTGDNEADEFFNSMSRVILSLSVSEPDKNILVVTENSSGSRSLHYFDRFGNLLFEMAPDLAIDGFNMSDDGNYVTIFAENRVQVYRTATSERLGSATSRSSIAQAAYFPDRNLILALGGELTNQGIETPEITAVDLRQRQIERVRLTDAVAYMGQSRVTIRREGTNTYRIDGINRTIKVTAQF